VFCKPYSDENYAFDENYAAGSGPSTAPPAHFLAYMRCMNASLAAASYLLDNEDRLKDLAVVVSAFTYDYFALSAFASTPHPAVAEGATLGHPLAVNAFKAVLVALDGGWAASLSFFDTAHAARFKTEQCNKRLQYLCGLRYTNAFIFAIAVAGVASPNQASPPPALALRGLYLMERLDPLKKEAMAGAPPQLKANLQGVEDAILTQLRGYVWRMKETLTPALTASDAPALRRLAASGGSNGPGGPMGAIAAQNCLLSMAAAAEAVDSRDEAALKARAHMLAYGGDCAYVGCTEMALPTPDGAPKGKANAVCSGCRLIRYGSACCQKADWPMHRRACKALQAERGE
jgi:hypothetical protein